jgi:hypothetical protein
MDDIINTADVGSVCETLVVGVKKTSDAHSAYTVVYVEYKENDSKSIFYDGSSWDTAEPTVTGVTPYAIRGESSISLGTTSSSSSSSDSGTN